METRVYAIKETEDVHEISNEDFINQAEDLGYVWSFLGFQNELNCEGSYVGLIPLVDRLKNMNLHFRFIDVPTEENELSDLEWLRKFASYISDKWNEAYNDASKFADSNNRFHLRIMSDGSLLAYNNVSGTYHYKTTTAKLRDYSAWYHILLVSYAYDRSIIICVGRWYWLWLVNALNLYGQ